MFIADKNYLLPTRVAIESLINCCKSDYKYNIYCIAKGLDEAEKRQAEFISERSIKIYLLDRNEFPVHATDIKRASLF